MSTKKADFYNRTLESFTQLKKDYPGSTLGRHIELAFGDYNNLMSITDKELSEALIKYTAELELNTLSDNDLDKIIKDGEELFNVNEDDSDEEESEDY